MSTAVEMPVGDEPATIVKRGRGRPRKNPVAEVPSPGDAPPVTPEKPDPPSLPAPAPEKPVEPAVPAPKKPAPAPAPAPVPAPAAAPVDFGNDARQKIMRLARRRRG